MSLNKGININKPVLSQIIFISTQRSLDICQSSDSSEESVRMSPVVREGREKGQILCEAGYGWVVEDQFIVHVRLSFTLTAASAGVWWCCAVDVGSCL